ncbi:MAG: branched-chain amino acid ABC transporter permease [Lachnotalea sp.]
MKRERIKRVLLNFVSIIIVFGILVGLCESGALSNYIKGILMVCCISIIMACSLNITVGYLGQIALGDCGFMAIGAYTAAMITKAMEAGNILVGAGAPNILRFLVAIIAGGIVAAVFGVLVGIPALRLRGDYLAIITLGFGEIIRVVIQNLKFTGGKGFSEGQAGQALIGINRISNLYVVFWVMVLSVSILYTFIRSKYGRAITAIRNDDIAASASGLNITFYKVLAFSVSAFFAGIAGGIFAHYIGSLNAATFGWLKSTEYVIMVVFGGMGSLTGSIIAAIMLTALPEILREFSDYRMLVYSVALILVMIYRPTGLFGTYEFSLSKILAKLTDKDKKKLKNHKENVDKKEEL